MNHVWILHQGSDRLEEVTGFSYNIYISVSVDVETLYSSHQVLQLRDEAVLKSSLLVCSRTPTSNMWDQIHIIQEDQCWCWPSNTTSSAVSCASHSFSHSQRSTGIILYVIILIVNCVKWENKQSYWVIYFSIFMLSTLLVSVLIRVSAAPLWSVNPANIMITRGNGDRFICFPTPRIKVGPKETGGLSPRLTSFRRSNTTFMFVCVMFIKHTGDIFTYFCTPGSTEM